MILTGKYNEIMGRLELSAEARDRILNSVMAGSAEETAPQGRILPISVIRRYVVAAACFAVVLLAVFALPRLRQGADEPPEVALPASITEYATAEELSASLGFPVEDVTGLPFAAEEVTYANFFDSFAQIVYRGSGASAAYRKACGNDDISGDYSEYEEVWETPVGGVSVTLKGNGGEVSLAIWQQDGYSYSLSLDPGIPEQEAVGLLRSLIE